MARQLAMSHGEKNLINNVIKPRVNAKMKSSKRVKGKYRSVKYERVK